MKKALLNKRGEVIGIVDVQESQKTIKVCDGYTVKRSIISNDLVYTTESNPVFEVLNQDRLIGVDTVYKDERDAPLNVREMRLSSSKKILKSQAFLESDYLTVQKGIVNLCTD